MPFLAATGDERDSLAPRRGDRIWRNVLCGGILPVPMDVPELPPAQAGQTTRQRFEDQHDKLECARGCHGIIDPIGFAFEAFAGAGDFRTTDNGKPVDASGRFTTPRGAVVSFKDGVEMVQALAAQEEVARCFGTKWFRFGLGRAEAPEEEAALGALLEAFAKAGGHVPTLLEALVGSRSFRFRTITEGEVL